MTDIQKQFWGLSRIGKTDIAYNIVLCSKIKGRLKEEKLAFAWQKLWSKFSKHNKLLSGENECIWNYKSMTAVEAEGLIKQEVNRGFNIQTEIPVRVFLLRTNENEHFFTVIIHHILIDLRVKELFSEIISSYYNTGDCVVEFSDYQIIEEQKQKEKQKKFWKKYLENSPDALKLPACNAFKCIFSGEGRTVYRFLSPELSLRLNRLDEGGEYQQFLILLTCYAVLLKKLSGQNEFFIGIPFPNRRFEDSGNMCGPLVNILPLRVNVGSNETFHSLYHYLRKQMLLLFRNQELPFIEILKFYHGERQKEIPYFLQTGFTREEPFNLSLEGLECKPVDIRPDGAQMDLFFTYWVDDNLIKYRCEYNTGTFSGYQIESLSDSFELMVQLFIENPERSVSQISIHTDKNKKSIDAYYNSNSRNYPVDRPLRQLLLQSYKKNEEHIAISDQGRKLTYKAFYILVCRYAGYIKKNVGSCRRIAVLMDSSIERIALIHAVIISDNTYVPIDIRWPSSRIGYIVKDAGISLCVIDKQLVNKLANLENLISITELDSFPDEIGDKETCINDNFAILYTSGSTGQPKGVEISVKGIINRLFWMQENFPLDCNSRLIHKVPFTFDVSIWEMFWPFLFGASLYIPDPGVHLDNNYLADILRSERGTYIHFVPSLLRNFLNTVNNFDFPDLEGVICSGEALEVPLVADFHKKLSGMPIHNLYGPTEASIDVTALTYVDETVYEYKIPIGYPIANTKIYILDEDTNICSPYVRGEIAITGISLAHGYVNNADQTQKAFITGDWGWGNETVYLTGDIGFYDDNCLVYYNGRMDTQVKINGVRIELSEIEQQIERLQDVKKAVVMVADYKDENKQIIAYLSANGNNSSERVRTELYRVLPGYMIPEKICFINDFPMSQNGKIDREKLKAMKIEEVNDPVDRVGTKNNRRDKMLNNIRQNRNLRTGK